MRLILAFLLLCGQAWCALAVVQHKVTQTGASQTTVAVTVTSTASNNMLVVAAGNSGTRTVTGVTDNIGNTYTQVASAAATQSTRGTDIWYTAHATAGVTSVTVTFSGAAGTFGKQGWVWEVSGFNSPIVDVVGIVNNGTAVANVATGASVTTTSSGFIVANVVISIAVDQNPLSGNEFTSGGDISGSNDGAVSLISSTAAAHQPQWHSTGAAPTFASSTAAFKESVGSVGAHRPLTY